MIVWKSHVDEVYSFVPYIILFTRLLSERGNALAFERVNFLEEWLMVFLFLLNDDWLWKKLTYHASFTSRICIFDLPCEYIITLISDKTDIWLKWNSSISDGDERKASSLSAFTSPGAARSGSNGLNQTYIRKRFNRTGKYQLRESGDSCTRGISSARC